MTFREWLVLSISSLIAGAAFAVPGYFLATNATSSLLIFIGWGLVILGVGAFLVYSGMLATVLFFGAIVALFFNPVVAVFCGIGAAVAYAHQRKTLLEMRGQAER